MTDPRDGAWYVVLDHGHFGIKLHRSDDRGASWDEVAVPEYPPKPEGFVDISMWGNEREWALANIWSLEPALDQPGALWCGTVPGGLFRSNDRGESWSLAAHVGVVQVQINLRCTPSMLTHAIRCGCRWRFLQAAYGVQKMVAQRGHRTLKEWLRVTCRLNNLIGLNTKMLTASCKVHHHQKFSGANITWVFGNQTTISSHGLN
jgi:hypothetical protein